MIGSELRGAVTVLTLERHAQRNALDTEHAARLLAAVTAAADAGSRCIVITGEGSSFCAGADLDGVHTPGFTAALGALLKGVVAVPVPVVAAVNGPAIGAGTQLAIACDLRVGSAPARFAVPTARLGLALDPWSIARLSALVGGGPARSLLLGATTVDAERALAVGLLDRLGTLADALTWAAEIAELAPLTLAYTKLVLNGGRDDEVPAGFERVWTSDDAQEGLRARAERRPVRFSGR